jgi:hypothetical protein
MAALSLGPVDFAFEAGQRGPMALMVSARLLCNELFGLAPSAAGGYDIE